MHVELVTGVDKIKADFLERLDDELWLDRGYFTHQPELRCKTNVRPEIRIFD